MRTIIVLLAVLSFLFVGCPGKGAAGSVEGVTENWMVTYLDSAKIGYSVSRVGHSRDGYRFENLMTMNVAMAGKSQDVHYSSVVETNLDLVMQAFDFTFQSKERSLTAAGAVQGDKIVVRSDGGESRAIALEGPVHPMSALGQLVMSRNPAADSVYDFNMFDVTVMSAVPVQATVLGWEKIHLGEKEVTGLKIKTKVMKVEMTSWLDSAGMTLQELSPPRMRSVRTTPKEAVASVTGQGQLDLLRMFRVPVDAVIPDPGDVREARIQVDGVDATDLEADEVGQRVVSQSPIVVETAVPSPPETVSLPISGQAEFLKPTLTVQCDNPEIRAKALEAVGELDDAVAVSRKLTSWVFAALEKEPTASFPSAIDVLRNMEGDCNEHAVFFAALARSLGIPTKIAVGLVYMDGAFYYHAWNEVFLDKWIPIDATFGEFPAGALRLRLSEGELSEQTQILSVVGGIKLRILSYE